MSVPATSEPLSDLLQAFLHTDYVVYPSATPLTVHIGECHPQLDSATDSRDWAVLTACNPAASRVPDALNDRLQQQLLDAVETAGLEHVSACNRDPAASWPDEPGLMVLEPRPEQIIGLARRFGQAGVVTGQPGQPACLWLFGNGWPDRLPPSVVRID